MIKTNAHQRIDKPSGWTFANFPFNKKLNGWLDARMRELENLFKNQAH